MNNEFTVEEIKNSVDYQWRKWQLKLLLLILLIAGVLLLFLFLIIFTSNGGAEFVGIGITVWLFTMGVCVSIFLPFCLFDYCKLRYLLKNYKRFYSYEAVLDNVSTPYWYRGAVYYTVVINGNGLSKKVRTNPCFSSQFLSKFKPEDFNNKKVVGLFDEETDRFYIIKIVD